MPSNYCRYMILAALQKRQIQELATFTLSPLYAIAEEEWLVYVISLIITTAAAPNHAAHDIRR